MFLTLNALLGLQDGAPPPESAMLLATDTLEPAAEFLLHHFIAAGVRSCSSQAELPPTDADSPAALRASPVLLLGLAAPFGHYAAVARKLGVNLSAAEQRGHFRFLDGLTSLTTMSREAAESSGTIGLVERGSSFGPVDAADEDALACAKRLCDDVESAAALLVKNPGADGRKGMYLLIDDISALLSAGAQARCVVEFTRGCARMVERLGGNLVVLAHADRALTLEPDHEYLLKSLMYSADYILAVQPLVTGYSRDVHGQLSVFPGPRPKVKRVAPRLVHYRITDSGNGVDFFAPGFATGVL